MGITASTEEIDMSGVHTEVLKVMTSNPRRVSEVHVDMFWDNCTATLPEIDRLKKIALSCPVALSIHPDIKQIVNFHF